MQVFISWSGRRSGETAKALSKFLKQVIQSTKPWYSPEMDRGVKWMDHISKALDSHTVGILCVTPGNQRRPWLCYEAGALSKHLGDNGRVIPYLVGFKSEGDLEQPLAQFNAAMADREGTLSLVQTINRQSADPLPQEDLIDTFNIRWDDFETALQEIVSSSAGQPPERRTVDDKLNEVLETVRDTARMVSTSLLRREPSSDNLRSRMRRAQDAAINAAQRDARSRGDYVLVAMNSYIGDTLRNEYALPEDSVWAERFLDDEVRLYAPDSRNSQIAAHLGALVEAAFPEVNFGGYVIGEADLARLRESQDKEQDRRDAHLVEQAYEEAARLQEFDEDAADDARHGGN